MGKFRFLALVLLVMITVSGYAQNDGGMDFFFSVGLARNFINADRHYLVPQYWLGEISILKFGGNVGLGLGPGRAYLGLEGGFSSGTNFGGQGGVNLYPIALSAAWYYPLVENTFSIGPSLKFGVLRLSGRGWSETVPMLGGRLEVEGQYPYFPLSLYAAAGFDMYPTAHESGTFPMVEIGLRFPRRVRARPEAPVVRTPPVVIEEPVDDRDWEREAREAREALITSINVFDRGFINPVYFEPETAVLLETYRPRLEAVARQMASDSSLMMLLRGYTAPYGTVESRYVVSEMRTSFTRDYLIQNYGISSDRITQEHYGSDRLPEHATADEVSLRCVELIFY